VRFDFEWKIKNEFLARIYKLGRRESLGLSNHRLCTIVVLSESAT